MTSGTAGGASLIIVEASLCADGSRSRSKCQPVIQSYINDVHSGDIWILIMRLLFVRIWHYQYKYSALDVAFAYKVPIHYLT